MKQANCIVRLCLHLVLYLISHVIFSHILTFRFKAPRRKHLFLAFSPLSHLLWSLLHLCPLLCSQLMQRVMAVVGEGDGNEYLMAYLITKRCPAAMVVLANARKLQNPIFFIYFTEGGKVIQEKQPFLLFLAAHYVAKAYMSKYFLLWAKIFFKDISCGWQ